ncbi:MAG: hypothetical protein AAGB02_02015 [Pseudomonadota bacterium]
MSKKTLFRHFRRISFSCLAIASVSVIFGVKANEMAKDAAMAKDRTASPTTLAEAQ